MSIGWMIDDLIDNGRYDGITTGWNFDPRSVGRTIPFSSHGSYLFSKLNDAPSKPTVNDLQNILFIGPDDSKEIRSTKIELVYEWKYVTEGRKNTILAITQRMSFEGTKMALNIALDDLNSAYKTILEIISREPDVYYSRPTGSKEDCYIQEFSNGLAESLLKFLENVDDEISAKEIVNDLKILTAIKLRKYNEDGEYECSTFDYISYLKECGLETDNRECRDCYADTRFRGFGFCLCCGKRIR